MATKTTPAKKAAAEDAPEAATAPTPEEHDHDRVALLSLRADGTPDQINPEVITDDPDPRTA